MKLFKCRPTIKQTATTVEYKLRLQRGSHKQAGFFSILNKTVASRAPHADAKDTFASALLKNHRNSDNLQLFR